MAIYEIELLGEAREVYQVEADSEEQARARWADGHLVVSEAYGMSIVGVEKTED
jgi:hypothetical protein